MSTATENPPPSADLTKVSSSRDPLAAEQEQLALMVMTLQKHGIDVRGMSPPRLAAEFSRWRDGQSREAEQEAAKKDLEARAEKARRDGVERRLRNNGIDPAGLSDDEIADKLDGIAKREHTEQLQRQNDQRIEDARRDRLKRLRRARCPERHIRNLDTEQGAEWQGVRDSIAERLGNTEGFLVALLGKRGTGKTQLAVSVIDEACRASRKCRYIKALDLFRMIRTSYTPRAKGQGGESEADLIDELVAYDLLVIDEAHQRGETDWEQNTLINLLDRRYDDLKYTILIANQDKAEFGAAMGDSVVSRIHESGSAIMCEWPSYRHPIEWKV